MMPAATDRFGAAPGRLSLAAAALCLAALGFAAAPRAQQEQGDQTLYGTPDPDAKQGGTLTVGSLVEPPALDPFHQAADARIQVSPLMYQGLMYEDASGVAQPLLAENVRVSDDGLTYTFDLREGVKFHTGADMTAADVKYSYDYIRDPAHGSPGAADFAMIEEIEVVDDHTVAFHLSEPNAALPMTLTNKYGAVVPEGYFDDPNAKARLNEQSVGTGPFKLQAFQPNSFLALERFEDYWQEGLPHLDAVRFVYLPNSASMVVALQNQRIDMALFSRPQDTEQFAGMKEIVVERFPSVGQKSLDLDHTYGPLQDKKVRQAIALAVDKGEVMRASIGDYGTEIGTIVAGMQDTWGLPLDEVPFQERDVERAKQLMEEAGYGDGAELTLTTIVGYDWMDPAAVTVAQQLKEIGIDVNIEKVDLGVWIDNFRSHNMGFTFNDWGTLPDPHLLYYRHYHKRPEGADFRNWDNEEASALLDEGQRTSDLEERRRIYREFQKLFAEDVPTIMMFSADQVVAHWDYVKNYQQHPTGWYFGVVRTWLDR